jgi:hypothetical protein
LGLNRDRQVKNDEKCFLSYAREDAPSAQKLYEGLSAAGASVWYDKESLKPGQKWEVAITKAIRASRYFIALLSSKSVTKKGFVQREIGEALAVLSEYPEDEVYLLPLRLDDCRPSHERMRELQWLDLFPNWEEGIAKLIRSLEIPARVRTDGLYKSGPYTAKEFQYWQYLRFYTDGTVLTSSTGEEDLAGIAKWLAKENEAKRGQGEYKLVGQTIEFSAQTSRGVIDYEGMVSGNEIILKIHSHINGHRGVAQYKFCPVPSM